MNFATFPGVYLVRSLTGARASSNDLISESKTRRVHRLLTQMTDLSELPFPHLLGSALLLKPTKSIAISLSCQKNDDDQYHLSFICGTTSRK